MSIYRSIMMEEISEQIIKKGILLKRQRGLGLHFWSSKKFQERYCVLSKKSLCYYDGDKVRHCKSCLYLCVNVIENNKLVKKIFLSKAQQWYLIVVTCTLPNRKRVALKWTESRLWKWSHQRPSSKTSAFRLEIAWLS